ncbi:hypothetical protein ACFQ9X_10780 [Catenulispora yoronensis]
MRYPWRADATFGTPQQLSAGFDGAKALAAGHFVGDGTAVQLLAVLRDGSAHVYAVDAGGGLVDQGTITGPDWASYTRLVAGRFTKDGGSWLVGIDKDGHAQLITVDAAGKTAKTGGLSVDPQLGAAPTILTEAVADGTDQLLTVDATGATATFAFDAERGFVKVVEPDGALKLQLPAPAAPRCSARSSAPDRKCWSPARTGRPRCSRRPSWTGLRRVLSSTSTTPPRRRSRRPGPPRGSGG